MSRHRRHSGVKLLHFLVQHLTAFNLLLQRGHFLLLRWRLLLSVGLLLFDPLHFFFLMGPRSSH